MGAAQGWPGAVFWMLEDRAAMRYAENTAVPVERSRAEIEAILARYGADHFASGWNHTEHVLGFRAKGRFVKFTLPIPDQADKKYLRDGRGAIRRPEARRQHWEQDCRQRWRALALVIKAKLEAVDTGITTFENEFLANIVIPGGDTIGNWLAPQIEEAYKSGVSMKALPLFTGDGG